MLRCTNCGFTFDEESHRVVCEVEVMERVWYTGSVYLDGEGRPIDGEAELETREDSEHDSETVTMLTCEECGKHGPPKGDLFVWFDEAEVAEVHERSKVNGVSWSADDSDVPDVRSEADEMAELMEGME